MIIATGLQVVERVMFGCGDDVIGLDSGDLRADDGPGEKRILSAIFEVAPVPWVANQVDAAGEHHVEARSPSLRANHLPALECKVGIPGRRCCHPGWKEVRSRLVAEPP